MINDKEVDDLTANTLNKIVEMVGSINPNDTYRNKYMRLLDVQDVLKGLVVKGYNMGIGETMLKDKKDE